ncbi:UNVERIFIED_CONTAM: hypothetical protein PYX00_000973 [Menopon gallinae]|uniref:Uncharacterized protein n=1 Tax=Menopon gallinae TaxID=328185 RepID=A0AAW2IB20_9NEOP
MASPDPESTVTFRRFSPGMNELANDARLFRPEIPRQATDRGPVMRNFRSVSRRVFLATFRIDPLLKMAARDRREGRFHPFKSRPRGEVHTLERARANCS